VDRGECTSLDMQHYDTRAMVERDMCGKRRQASPCEQAQATSWIEQGHAKVLPEQARGPLGLIHPFRRARQPHPLDSDEGSRG
jgi:hypothetical protein